MHFFYNEPVLLSRMKSMRRASMNTIDPLNINLCNFMSDSAVRNCNRLFWMKNDNFEILRLWNLDKEMKFNFEGEMRKLRKS